MLQVFHYRCHYILGDETEYDKFRLRCKKDAVYLRYFTDLEDFSNLQK